MRRSRRPRAGDRVPAGETRDASRRLSAHLFTRASQREGFRQYLAGLLPTERNKTLTALAYAEPVVGAQRPGVQRLQRFLSESTWEAAVVRRSGLRTWVEQQDTQVAGSLGWSQDQVRSDVAMRRHWALVQCAIAFCWWAESRTPRRRARQPRRHAWRRVPPSGGKRRR